MNQFEEALSQLASLHAQELTRVQTELQTKIEQLQASLMEAEALKTAAAEPQALAAVIEHIAQELQEPALAQEATQESQMDETTKHRVYAKAQSVTFEDEKREGSVRSRLSSSDEKTRLEMLECQRGLLTSNMNEEARSKLYRMQEEMYKKEKAIGEINARVRNPSVKEQEGAIERKVTLAYILNSRAFGLFVAGMIIFNSILLGSDVNRNKAALEEQILVVLGEICNAFFFIELMLRLWCYRTHFFCGDELGWNFFDSFLVLSSILDVVLTYTATNMSPAVAGSVKMLKLFRIMRVFRVFRFFRQLANWAMMILDSLKSLFGALILLGIIIYVFAVSLSMNTADWLIMQEKEGVTDELKSSVDFWFGSLGKTLYTLLLSILGGVSWHLVCDLLLEIDILSAVLLLFYIMFTIFSVLNVITGVFVDSAIQTSNSQRDIQIEREMELKDSFLKSLKGFFEALDTDGSGSIHLEEIKIMLQDPTLAAYFAVLGFDEVNANQIFHLLDDDESGEVSIEEFLDGCSKLKGAARSIDVHALMHQCRALHRELTYVASMLGVDMQSAAALASRPQWFGRASGGRTTQAILGHVPED